MSTLSQWKPGTNKKVTCNIRATLALKSIMEALIAPTQHILAGSV